MREFFERKCREHGVTWTYTADGNWYAKPLQRRVWVPPPVDDEAFAVALHEAAHCVIGRCPGGPLHFDQRRNGTAACLECERQTSERALQWASTPRMRERLRSALATYRRSVPAPVAAMERADEQLGVVSAFEKKMQRLRFEEKVARQARARRAL
jgi:hypothetical protein